MQRYLWLIVWLATASAAVEREPRLGYLYPAGGQRGTACEVVLGGVNLSDATAAFCSGSGVQALILKQERQVTPQQQQELRERLSRLQEKRQLGIQLMPEEQRQADEIRRTLTMFGRRLANPSLGEFITLKVTISAAAVAGRHEVRLLTRLGLTNPRPFWVGDLPEYRKPDWKNVPQSRESLEAANDPAPAPVDIGLPLVLNGQISPGCVDQYRFAARAGQRVVVAVKARELIPYLADAVPGWFQATAALYDPQGHEVAYAGDYWFRPDPVICYQIPVAGTYRLELRDSLYRGREDFIYRVTLGELPFLTGAFPAGGRLGSGLPVALTGWNLPAAEAVLPAGASAPGIHLWQPWPQANELPLEFDSWPELLEVEPNDTPATAQQVTLPVVINGHVDRPGDWDHFAFDGQAGQQVVAEVYARRLDSPLDSVLLLLAPDGRQLAANDDQEDLAAGLETHHADSYLRVTLPETGRYTVALGDTQHGGGAAWRYRLRLTAPRPEFELRVAPSSLNVHGGSSVPVTAFALRHDGFDGEIALALDGAPTGYRLTAAVIPAHQDRVTFTLSAPAQATPVPLSLRLTGRATLAGREVVHPALPADNMMQAFSYRHLVPTQDLKVAVIGRFRPGAESRWLTASPLRLQAGGTARLQASLALPPALSKVEFGLHEPPAGLTVTTLSASSLELRAEAGVVPTGWRGNLIVTISAERPTPPGGPPLPAERRRMSLGALPALPCEVVP